MSARFQNEPGGSERDGEARPSAGLEILGVVVFLVGCLPGAAVAKALFDGTDLTAEGLGGTAALAGGVASWVGPWPGLVIAALVGILGVRMVLGSVAAEPLRFVAGAVVSGLGFAAVMSALRAGAGGQLGDGTGGALAAAVGTWAGVLLGLGVIAASAWLAFDRGAADDRAGGDGFEDDLIDDEPGSRGRAALASIGGAAAAAVAAARSVPGLFRGGRKQGTLDPARRSPGVLAGRADRRKRVSPRRRRRGDPITLGDALTQNDTEGVSLDEAAALAPDDRTLAYMEEVWRRASQSLEQPTPLPPSPYPEDVRLRGEIPPGAQPLVPGPFGGPVAPPSEAGAASGSGSGAGAAQAPRAHVEVRPVTPSDDPFAVPGADIAPFDFADELSDPVPLEASASSTAPFAPRDITPAEVEALRSAALREGASQQGPSELPPGVTPLLDPEQGTKGSSAAEARPAAGAPPTFAGPPAREALDSRPKDSLSAEALIAGAMPATSTPPPRPSWETDVDDEPTPEPPGVVDLDDVPDVAPGGRWPRRDDALTTDEPAAEDPVAEDPVSGDPVAGDPEAGELEAEVEEDPEVDPEESAEEAYGEDDAEDEDAEEDAEEAELEEEEDYEYVDEDGNPIDPEDLLEGEYELVEDGEEEDGEEEDAEEEDAEEVGDEYEEYEEEEEDGEEEAAAEAEEGEEPAADAGEDAEYEAVEDADENQVVLEPHAAAAPPTPKALSTDAARICEAGRVVVREGRVAVSVLQREFEMEFDEACALLDQLQDEGLIGPYKGGKKREILLTLEQWDERFVAS